MHIPSILVVDDEPTNFNVIEFLLGDRHYQFHYASNGREALSFLNSYNPDLILLDVMMPDLDGIAVCQQIKALPQWENVPIIMVTALSSKTDLANCLNAGADDFISKPIHREELRARVHSMLRIKQQYDTIQSLSQMQADTINTLKTSLGELRGTLASSLSHELNTPLHGILAPVEFINQSLEDLSPTEIREMLGWVTQSARRIGTLTQRSLSYLELETSIIHQQENEYIYTKFSAADLEATLRSNTASLNRNSDLIFELEEAVIAISEDYLATLFQELVNNALKFSPQGTPVKIKSQIMGEVLQLSVQDYGRGMTAAQISQIGAFIQFDRKKHEQQGLGIGLTIVQKIVELAGGTFAITSVYQQETTVTITLPIVSTKPYGGSTVSEQSDGQP